jgi:hypothetical protein
MGDFTRMVQRAQAGDGKAAAEIFPLVYELRQLAAARMAKTRHGTEDESAA